MHVLGVVILIGSIIANFFPIREIFGDLDFLPILAMFAMVFGLLLFKYGKRTFRFWEQGPDFLCKFLNSITVGFLMSGMIIFFTGIVLGLSTLSEITLETLVAVVSYAAIPFTIAVCIALVSFSIPRMKGDTFT